VGEIDDVHHAEHQRQPESHENVNRGIRLRRDDLESVVYSMELNSNTSLVTPQRTDRYGILDQKPPGFQLLLP
jgi:hypothetical protein